MSIFPGFSVDVRMAFESAWGAEQDTGHLVLPYRQFGLAMGKTAFSPEMNVGHVRRAYQIPWKNVVEGKIMTMFFRSTADMLLKWCLTRHGEGDEAWSATVDKRTPIGVRRYTGCVVDKATFTFNFVSGDVTAALDVKGKLEKTSGIAAFAVPTYTDEIPFVSRHAAATLWGAAQERLESLTLNVSNDAEEGPPDADGNVTWLCATRRQISGSFKVVYADDTYTDILTGETKGAVSVALTHPLGGTGGSATITLPEVLMTAAEPSDDLKGVVRQEVTFQAETHSEGDDVRWSVS